jgi:hypothetical protein
VEVAASSEHATPKDERGSQDLALGEPGFSCRLRDFMNRSRASGKLVA